MNVPWPVFGSDGRMMLSKGQEIGSYDRISVLLSCGACRKLTPEEKKQSQLEESVELPLLEHLDEVKQRNYEMLGNINNGQEGDYLQKLDTLVDEISTLSQANSDLMLGALLMDKESPYTMLHPIMSAIICRLMTNRLEINEDDMRTLMIAALVSNVGMFKFMDELSDQTEPLSEDQRIKVQAHPRKSYEMLKGVGLINHQCLDIVLKHHEKLDGSGYPYGLYGSEIPLLPSILSLTDIYSAILLPRKYRKGIYGRQAIQFVFAKRGEKINKTLVGLFIKEIGIYPPGLFVKLTNNEKGIVIKRGKESADRPIVSALYNDYGARHDFPRIRDTAKANGFIIVENLCPEEELPFEIMSIWGYGR